MDLSGALYAATVHSVLALYLKSHVGLAWIGRMKVVHVEWVDSEASVGWEPRSSITSTPLIAPTVGFLMKETDEFLLVAHSYDSVNDHFNGGIKIPIVSIVTITVLCGIRT